jgi:hypothetical protein
MKLALLLAALLAAAPLRAEPQAGAPPAAWKPPTPPRLRHLGVGLLAGGLACIAVGAVFVGLAAKANGDVLANMTYHPSSEDERNSFQITYGTLFIAGGAATVSGVVLLW